MKIRNKNAQAIIEFTFCMIILFIMMYGLMKVFQWSGTDLAKRRQAHDSTLKGGVVADYSVYAHGPIKQLDPHIGSSAPINAVWRNY